MVWPESRIQFCLEEDTARLRREAGEIPAPLSAMLLPEMSSCGDEASASAGSVGYPSACASGRTDWHYGQGRQRQELPPGCASERHGRCFRRIKSARIDDIPLVEWLAAGARVVGRVSFCSQPPWILAGTVRENIVFGQPFCEERYHQVIHSCALQQDLDQFPDRDNTELGERGINISGRHKRWRRLEET